MDRLYPITLLLLAASCSAYGSQSKGVTHLPFQGEIVYLSSDMEHVAVFSREKTRFGPTNLTIANQEWPSDPATYFDLGQGISCISVGSESNSLEYAIKRPIKMDDKYKCLRTEFQVTRCFNKCRAAIIEIDRPLSGNREGTLEASMYVENCRGVIILSAVSDLSEGIPLSAEWLRGEVGILADPAYPNCKSF